MIVQIVCLVIVCGYLLCMCLDVLVNLLMMQVLVKGKIIVFGGIQVCLNIYIDDIIDVYLYLIDYLEIIGVYNVGFENIFILDIVCMVVKYILVDIVVIELNDLCFYCVNLDKLLVIGFKLFKLVEIVIIEIIEKYCSGVFKDEDCYYNLKWMEQIVLFFKVV